MSKAGTADTAYTRIGFDSSTGEFVDYCPNCGDILPDNQKYICRKKHILSDYIKKLIQMPDGIEKLDKIIDVLYSYPDAWWYYSQSELRKNITSKTLDVIDTNEYMLIHGLHKYTSTLKDNNTINWNTKISMQNFAKRLANFISSPNIDTDQPIIADIIQSQQPQTLVHPSFVPVVPASERDLVDNFSSHIYAMLGVRLPTAAGGCRTTGSVGSTYRYSVPPASYLSRLVKKIVHLSLKSLPATAAYLSWRLVSATQKPTRESLASWWHTS